MTDTDTDADSDTSMSEQISLLGIAADANSSFLAGCALGPAAIRGALRSDSGNDANEASVSVTPHLDDLGDVDIANVANSSDDADAITAAVRGQLAAGRRVISIGGDHFVTFPILRAFREFHTDLTVVHIDAHPDMYDDFAGNPFSHASPFARALEHGCMTRLIQLGIRTATQHQVDQADRWNVTMLTPRQLDRFDAASITGPVYFSLDLDGLDPSCAPGVSHHEPGGLTFREVLDVIDAIPGPIVGADVVELNPTRDLVDMTAMVGAKFVKELAGAMLANPPV